MYKHFLHKSEVARAERCEFLDELEVLSTAFCLWRLVVIIVCHAGMVVAATTLLHGVCVKGYAGKLANRCAHCALFCV